MEHIARVMREIAAAARLSQDALRAAAAPPETPEQRMGLELTPGSRVLDRVTGQEGEVLAGSTANYIVPVAGR